MSERDRSWVATVAAVCALELALVAVGCLAAALVAVGCLAEAIASCRAAAGLGLLLLGALLALASLLGSLALRGGDDVDEEEAGRDE